MSGNLISTYCITVTNHPISPGDLSVGSGVLHSESVECSELYEMVFCKTGMYLCSKKKANEAILLSTLYNSFLTDIQSEASNYKLLDPLYICQ